MTKKAELLLIFIIIFWVFAGWWLVSTDNHQPPIGGWQPSLYENHKEPEEAKIEARLNHNTHYEMEK